MAVSAQVTICHACGSSRPSQWCRCSPIPALCCGHIG